MVAFNRSYKQDVTAPAGAGAAVTPNDSTDLTFVSRGLWIGTTGDITVTMEEGGDLTFSAVPDGTLLPLRVSRVLATGTSATNIVAIW